MSIYNHTGIYLSEKKIWKAHKHSFKEKKTIFRSSHHRCSIKAVLKNLAIFTTRKHLWWSVFLIMLQTSRPATLLKKTPAQVFSCEYCKIFKNIYFEDHLQTAASASWSILYKEFVDISYDNGSFGIQEDSICLQLIYFF